MNVWKALAYKRGVWAAYEKRLAEYRADQVEREAKIAAARREVNEAEEAYAAGQADASAGQPVAAQRVYEARHALRTLQMSVFGLSEPSGPEPRWIDSYGDWKIGYAFTAFIVGVVAVLVGLIFSICLIVRQIDHHYQHQACPRKGEALAVEVRWAEFNFWDYDCLANVQGRWVPVGTVNNDTGVWLRGDEGR